MANRKRPAVEPAHPGEFLAEIVIPATERTKLEIARLLGVSRQTLYDIMRERRAVTPDMALRLGKLFGNGPEFWLSMQQAHDLWHAERQLRDEIRAMPTLRAA